jgi:hypothetical protein
MKARHSTRKSSALSAGLSASAAVPRGWTRADFARLRPQLRLIVDDLVRGVLAAITAASAAEIGEAISLLAEDRRLEGVRTRRSVRGEAPVASPKTNGLARANGRSEAARSPSGHGGSRSGRETDNPRPSLVPHSPFDITSPGDLLASVVMRASSLADERAHAQAATAADAAPAQPSERASSSLLNHGPTASPSPADIEAASERRPRVVLREGESLLSATGSGVVIRRERRVAPPR